MTPSETDTTMPSTTTTTKMGAVVANATTTTVPIKTTVTTATATPATKPEPQPTMTGDGAKLCHIRKRANFDGYGFNLHSEKCKPGQFIGKVDDHSPASEAGLKEGDRIVAVNGVSIGGETHKQVVERIKAVADEVRLLLIDVDGDAKLTNNNNNKQENENEKSEKLDQREQKEQREQTEQRKGCMQEMAGVSANISTISMISTKRRSADVTDRRSNSSENNNNSAISRPMLEQPKQQNNNGNVATMKMSVGGVGGLQLPMTAAEMRTKLMSRKKYDPKNEGVDLKKKFEIIQKL